MLVKDTSKIKFDEKNCEELIELLKIDLSFSRGALMSVNSIYKNFLNLVDHLSVRDKIEYRKKYIDDIKTIRKYLDSKEYVLGYNKIDILLEKMLSD